MSSVQDLLHEYCQKDDKILHQYQRKKETENTADQKQLQLYALFQNIKKSIKNNSTKKLVSDNVVQVDLFHKQNF
jgi:hypothetical protein